jgi:hypothetical protein
LPDKIGIQTTPGFLRQVQPEGIDGGALGGIKRI